jgi:hypothetical protein
LKEEKVDEEKGSLAFNNSVNGPVSRSSGLRTATGNYTTNYNHATCDYFPDNNATSNNTAYDYAPDKHIPNNTDN